MDKFKDVFEELDRMTDDLKSENQNTINTLAKRKGENKNVYVNFQSIRLCSSILGRN